MTRYDAIGRGYARGRRSDPRFAAPIHAALEGCDNVVNVGAGTGSYEPTDRAVVAVEPSSVMLGQRPATAAPAVRAEAGALPFRDAAFDASLAVLTLHHWPDLEQGLRELRRVASKRTVILTFDTGVADFWLTDYFPEILELDAKTMPALSRLQRALGPLSVHEIPVPHDCMDGILGAYWRRPEAYLDPDVRAATSVFSLMEQVEPGLQRLRADLESGAWHERNGALLAKTECDLGYRLIVT